MVLENTGQRTTGNPSLDVFCYVSISYGEVEAYSSPFTIFEAIYDPGYLINIGVGICAGIIPRIMQSCSITRKAVCI